jgi:hypothetical protein
VPTRFKARVTKCVEPIQAMVPSGCLYGLPSDPDVQCLIRASLHGIDDGLGLPALDAALLTVVHCALIGQVTEALAQ